MCCCCKLKVNRCVYIVALRCVAMLLRRYVIDGLELLLIRYVNCCCLD